MANFKNVFILCTGRCGSKTIINAFEHSDNFSAGHESKAQEIGSERLNYPDFHIEADNRLSWFLGRLENKYGSDPLYVHLTRDKQKTAESLTHRWGPFSIMKAYTFGILKTQSHDLKYALDYVETIDENITAFLKDKKHVVHIKLENIEEDFKKLWDQIGAKGDLQKALTAINKKDNATQLKPNPKSKLKLKLYHLKIALREFFN